MHASLQEKIMNKYRIKEIYTQGETWFVPQVKTFFWYSDMVHLVAADMTGYIKEDKVAFKSLEECKEFIRSEIRADEIKYHYLK
jgi:hypothetical protein